MSGADGAEQTPPAILETLWENWQAPAGGKGRCEGCPAHWSIREDVAGTPGERSSSFQHRPFCGDGSFAPDIAIIAEEPGPPREEKHDKNKRERSLSDVRHSSIIDSPGGTIENAMPLFEEVVASEFEGYFTQLRSVTSCGRGTISERESSALAPARNTGATSTTNWRRSTRNT